jgi:hypothetical protein
LLEWLLDQATGAAMNDPKPVAPADAMSQLDSISAGLTATAGAVEPRRTGAGRYFAPALSIVLVTAFIAPVALKLMDPALITISGIGVLMLVIDAWQALHPKQKR